MPNGTPTPMQPNGPGSSIVRADRPTRREAQEVAAVGRRRSASAPQRVLHRGEQPVRMHAPVACRSAPCAIGSAQLRGALLVAGAQPRRPVPVDRRARGCRPPRRSPRSAAAGAARISTAPRRLSRSSRRRHRRCARTAPRRRPPASRRRAGSRAGGRPSATTSASPITGAAHRGDRPRDASSGTRPRLSPVSR